MAYDPWEDGRKARGRRTRESILQTAADIASVEGLEGLTIGRLATELEMSKSGLFAHFGSKEELQLATNAAARERFVAAVIAPLRDLPPGRERLQTLVDGWIAYLREEVFAGGCFFTTVRVEFDAREAGPVRDAVEADQRDWLARLSREVRGALGDDVDADQLAFEIDVTGMGANVQYQLLRDPAVFDRAARALAARLA